MKQKLALIRKLQSDYPELVLGGSLGLFLHGMRIRTALQYSKTDLDFTSAKSITIVGANANEDLFNESADMDVSWMEGDTRCELQIDPDIQSIIICHEGFEYRVATFMHICRWKHHYSDQRHEKHMADWRMILTSLTMPPDYSGSFNTN